LQCEEEIIQWSGKLFFKKIITATNQRLQVEGEGSVLVVVELAVGRLAGGADAVQAQLARAGLARVDEAADVAAQSAQAKTVAGANDLGPMLRSRQILQNMHYQHLSKFVCYQSLTLGLIDYEETISDGLGPML
jgi:hypothetical protein